MVLLLASLLVLASAPNAQDGREIAKLVAPDAEPDDYFGKAVAIDGDIAVVGAPSVPGPGSLSGAVYVFQRYERVGIGSPTRTAGWRFQKKIVSAEGSAFGEAVAFHDGLLLVGAPWTSTSDHDYAGLVYGYRRNRGGLDQWGEAFRIHSPSAQDLGLFGSSLDGDGDTLVIGSGQLWAPGRGAAFVFTTRAGNADDWRLEASLEPTPGSYGNYDPWGFGHHVSISSNAIIVASANETTHPSSGGLHVFDHRQVPPDRWHEVAFIGSPNAWRDWFGLGGSEIRGGTIFVNAVLGDALFLFERNLGGPNAWGLAKTVPQDTPLSLAMDGELLAVGSPWPLLSAPFVRIHSRDLDGPDSWPPVADLQASDADGRREGFGHAVAMDGDAVLVGHPDEERAYVFDFTPPNSASIEFRTDSQDLNPASYTGTPPVIGGSYDAVVDLTTTGHSLAALFAYDAPAEIPLATGYVLLCTDLGSGPLFPFLVAAGPLASFTLPIPDDPRLFGLPLFTQAAHFGGPRPFALSNAQDLVLGYE